MAQGGERRMLFDIRGKRRHVIKVVYAILALLMGASLFLVVGPVNIGSLLGNSTSSESGAKIFEERAARLERELRKSPGDSDLQLALIRTQISGGRAAAETDPTTGAPIIGADSREQFEAATETWGEYVKSVGRKNASPTTAQLIAQSWVVLAENPNSFEEAFESLEEAAKVQEIYAEAKPSVNSYSTLAILQLVGGNFKEGDASGKKAEELATSKAQRKEVQKQLASSRKQGKENLKNKKQVEKLEKGKGKEQLENPLGGLGGGAPSFTGE